MKNYKKMKKQELVDYCNELGINVSDSETADALRAKLDKHFGSSKGTFKLIKQKYEAREDAKVSKEWTPKSGELKILREIEWNSDKNDKDETLIFFKVGQHPEEHLTFSGMLVAAANKANIELISETEDGLVMNQGFNVSIAARKFEFDSVE